MTSPLPFVLHVSGDFPDSIDEDKTKVVRSLVDLTQSEFEHRVLSLNRVSPSARELAREVVRPAPLKVNLHPFTYGGALVYSAPPRGIRHETKLIQLGQWLADYIARLDRKPDLIVAHKLAIEGICVREASRILGIPYAISIQGDTDTKVLDIRRDLRKNLRVILNEARFIFPFSAWSWRAICERLGTPETPHSLLPCPTELDEPLAPTTGGKVVSSVFHLKSHKRKNLQGLADAFQILNAQGFAMPLEIAGGGDSKDIAASQSLLSKSPLVRLLGAMDRDGVRAHLNQSAAFVLPSLRETFGLVFVEALFAGTPIIYPEGTSVDGFFDDCPFAIRVPAKDARAIADAVKWAVENEATLKEQLAAWQVSDHAKRFQRPAIAKTFCDGLNVAMSRA